MEQEQKSEHPQHIVEHHKKKRSVLNSFRENPWIISTIVLAIIAIILIIPFGSNGKVVSEKDVGQKLLELYTSQGVTGLTLDSVKEVSGVYQVNFKYQGAVVPVYITKDASLVGSLTAFPASNNSASANTNTQAAKDVPKSDKPVVEAFVFAYCPYGLQFEKALFPVYDLLKTKANINLVYIGAMHGDFEHIESLRQLAISNLYGKDKLVTYLKEFDTSTDIGSCNGDAACLDKNLPALYVKLGMNKADIEAYMNKTSESLYQTDEARASQLGIQGSPTFVINGVEVQVGRTADAIKAAVCSAFTNAPAECNQNLSTASPSPGFGASSGSATAASCGN